MSATLAAKGFKAVAIDHVKNRHKQCHPCVCIDLASDEGFKFVVSLLKSGTVLYLHAAPPYGTARENKLSRRLRKQPLRSSAHPHGVPGLSDHDKRRVETANQIYDRIARLVRVAIANNVCVSVENPTKSFMWATTYFTTLIQEELIFEVAFQQCMWGAKHNSWSSWYVSDALFKRLQKACDNSHEHEPWGLQKSSAGWTAAASNGAAYPQMLCNEVAAIVYDLATQQQVQDVAIPSVTKRAKTSQTVMAAAGKQPRGDRFPPIISEFAFTVLFRVDDHFQMPCDRKLSQQQCSLFGIPFPAKILQIKKGKTVGESKADSGSAEIEVGVWQTPQQYLKRSLEISHPFDDSSGVDDVTKINIFRLLTEGPEDRRRQCEVLLNYYENRAAALQSDEDVLHFQLDEDRRQIVAGKKFLVFDELCRDAGLVGEDLHLLQLQGVPLVGKDGPTALFKHEVVEPALTTTQLMKSSRWSRKMIMKKDSCSATDEFRNAVWQITMEEVAKGWIQGPLDEAQVAARLGPLFVASKRFGLVQSDKVRRIDNLTDSLVNSAFGSSYKLELEGVDGISVLARTFLEATDDQGVVSVTLKDGSRRVGKLHPSLTVAQARSLGGRTLDLDAAYKQVLVSKATQWCNVIAVDDPQGERRLFISHVLPFGASASVYGFNKVAKALRLIGSKLFGLVWSQYYDDYPQIDLLCAGDWAQQTAERLLSLIGWRFSTKPAKRVPLASRFTALGVEFNFSDCQDGFFKVTNKQSRAAQLVDDVARFTNEGEISEADAARFMGQMQFAESQTYGRAVSLHMKDMRSRSVGKKPGKHLTDSMLAELSWACNFLTTDPPRLLRAHMSTRKLIIFTDAALENSDTEGTVGMVALWVVNDHIVEKYFFADTVPSQVMKLLQGSTRKVISGLELLAGALAVHLLKEFHSEGRMFLYVDNEAARASLISMNSSVSTHVCILKALNRLAACSSLFLWVSRVPSASNPAGPPSRGVLSDLIADGYLRVSIPWHVVESWLSDARV